MDLNKFPFLPCAQALSFFGDKRKKKKDFPGPVSQLEK
jgi:hypothetical protein